MIWCHLGWHWVLDHGVTHTSFHVEIDNFFCFVAVLLLLTMYIYVKVLVFVCHHMPLLGPLIIIKFKVQCVTFTFRRIEAGCVLSSQEDCRRLFLNTLVREMV